MQDPKERQLKKFKKLDEEWRNDMLGREDQDVDKEIRQAAMNLVTLEMAKEFDEDLLALKEQLKTANEQYTEGKKSNLLKIEFLLETLRSRGRTDIPSVDDFVKGAAKKVISDTDGDEFADLKNAAAELKEKFAKAVGPGNTITLSVPGKTSATIEGK